MSALVTLRSGFSSLMAAAALLTLLIQGDAARNNGLGFAPSPSGAAFARFPCSFRRGVSSQRLSGIRMMAEETPEEKRRRVLDKVIKQSAAIEKAEQAAREAEERAAALKKRVGSGTILRGSSPVRIPPPPPVPQKREAAKEEEEEETYSPSGKPSRVYSHKFLDFSLEKPMGMILEDNDASIGGVYVKEITPNSPAGGAEGLMEGAQIVSISGKSVKGANFESVMEILKASESPVDVQFYDGSASSLYGGWGERPQGKEVSVIPDRPSKALIERIRSGL